VTPTGSLGQVLRRLCAGLADFADCDPLTVSSVGTSGETPLHVAVSRGDLPAVEVLLQNGANVNGSGENTETPLHVAIRQRNPAAVQLLLQHGARLDVRSEFARTPPEEAARCVNEANQILHMVQKDKRHGTCSFCGRTGNEHQMVIESSFGGRICERCIDELPRTMGKLKGNEGAA
jgi:ankyrin repeat protein